MALLFAQITKEIPLLGSSPRHPTRPPAERKPVASLDPLSLSHAAKARVPRRRRHRRSLGSSSRLAPATWKVSRSLSSAASLSSGAAPPSQQLLVGPARAPLRLTAPHSGAPRRVAAGREPEPEQPLPMPWLCAPAVPLPYYSRVLRTIHLTDEEIS